MLKLICLLVLLSCLPCTRISAQDYRWGLDTLGVAGLQPMGSIRLSDGVQGKSVAFDGQSLLKLKESETLTHSNVGFTLTAWVNPYRTGGGQQMLACKNQYALSQREWGLMIDKDHKFRLYVWQGKWVTVDSEIRPELGRWYLIGVVVRPSNAELWINGKIVGTVDLAEPIRQTAAPITFGGVDDNGRVWQTLRGAMDEIHIAKGAWDAKEMKKRFQPISATHSIPDAPRPYELWDGPAIPDDVTKIPFAAHSDDFHHPSTYGATTQISTWCRDG